MEDQRQEEGGYGIITDYNRHKDAQAHFVRYARGSPDQGHEHHTGAHAAYGKLEAAHHDPFERNDKTIKGEVARYGDQYQEEQSDEVADRPIQLVLLGEPPSGSHGPGIEQYNGNCLKDHYEHGIHFMIPAGEIKCITL